LGAIQREARASALIIQTSAAVHVDGWAVPGDGVAGGQTLATIPETPITNAIALGLQVATTGSSARQGIFHANQAANIMVTGPVQSKVRVRILDRSQLPGPPAMDANSPDATFDVTATGDHDVPA